jgi:hypothetical protein
LQQLPLFRILDAQSITLPWAFIGHFTREFALQESHLVLSLYAVTQNGSKTIATQKKKMEEFSIFSAQQ